MSANNNLLNRGDQTLTSFSGAYSHWNNKGATNGGYSNKVEVKSPTVVF